MEPMPPQPLPAITLPLALLLAAIAPPATAAQPGFPCQPLTCSTLIPSLPVDDPHTNDCAYRAGNLWWLDYVAGSLAWKDTAPAKPVIVAVFDDGADIDHEELRN